MVVILRVVSGIGVSVLVCVDLIVFVSIQGFESCFESFVEEIKDK